MHLLFDGVICSGSSGSLILVGGDSGAGIKIKFPLRLQVLFFLFNASSLAGLVLRILIFVSAHICIINIAITVVVHVVRISLHASCLFLFEQVAGLI
jgi:hypothetical protein